MIAKRRKAALFRLHADQHARIRRPRAAEAADDRLVARELEVAVGKDVHRPHQRIEPVRARGGDEQELPQRVKAPDVHKFVLQHIRQRPFVRPVYCLRH